jgi:hypothetical protein
MAITTYSDGSDASVTSAQLALQKNMNKNTVQQMVMMSNQAEQQVKQLQIQQTTDVMNSTRKITSNIQL